MRGFLRQQLVRYLVPPGILGKGHLKAKSAFRADEKKSIALRSSLQIHLSPSEIYLPFFVTFAALWSHSFQIALKSQRTSAERRRSL
jgi:hypothetical protein